MIRYHSSLGDRSSLRDDSSLGDYSSFGDHSSFDDHFSVGNNFLRSMIKINFLKGKAKFCLILISYFSHTFVRTHSLKRKI